MSTLSAVLRQLAVVVWVGGLCFFAFVVAPVAFHVLPDTHLAGLVVAGTLGWLHRIGPVAGIVFLLATVAGLPRRATDRGSAVGDRRIAVSELLLVVSMLLLTAGLQFGIVPAMERARLENGGVVRVEDRSPAAVRFQSLHRVSERVEGAVLLAGLVVAGLLAAESSARTLQAPSVMLEARQPSEPRRVEPVQ